MTPQTETKPNRTNVYEVRNPREIVRDLSFSVEWGKSGAKVDVVVDPTNGFQIASWQLEEPKADGFLNTIRDFEPDPGTQCVVGTLEDTTHRKVQYSDLKDYLIRNGQPAYLTICGPRNTYHWHLSGTGGSTTAVTSPIRLDTEDMRYLFNRTNKGKRYFSDKAQETLGRELAHTLKEIRSPKEE